MWLWEKGSIFGRLAAPADVLEDVNLRPLAVVVVVVAVVVEVVAVLAAVVLVAAVVEEETAAGPVPVKFGASVPVAVVALLFDDSLLTNTILLFCFSCMYVCVLCLLFLLIESVKLAFRVSSAAESIFPIFYFPLFIDLSDIEIRFNNF